MKMRTTLNRRSNFFMDGCNVLFHIDLFLVNELLYRVAKGDTLFGELFHRSIPKDNTYYTSHEKDIKIIQSAATKKSQNILYDLIDKELYTKKNNQIKLEVYVAMLYHDFLLNPTCPEYIQMTEFGNTVRILTNDTNLGRLYIRVPFITEFLKRNILEGFAGEGISKISIVTGDTVEFATMGIFDTFVLEDITEVDSALVGNVNKRVEVLVPDYEYNMMEDRTDVEKLFEQVTYRRLKLQEHPKFYMDKGIMIHTMSVPL